MDFFPGESSGDVRPPQLFTMNPMILFPSDTDGDWESAPLAMVGGVLYLPSLFGSVGDWLLPLLPKLDLLLELQCASAGSLESLLGLIRGA